MELSTLQNVIHSNAALKWNWKSFVFQKNSLPCFKPWRDYDVALIEPTTPGWIIFTCYRGNIASRRGDNKYCWINTVSRQFAKIAKAVRKKCTCVVSAVLRSMALAEAQPWHGGMSTVLHCFTMFCTLMFYPMFWEIVWCLQHGSMLSGIAVQAADVRYCGCALLPMLYWALLANPVPVLILQNEDNTSEQLWCGILFL